MSAIEKKQQEDTAIFAGGCFWCIEHAFDELPGVLSTTSGYTGGNVPNPTYSEVSHGGTGHYEAVKVIYNPSKISYDDLLTVFWHNIDPLNDKGQFCDYGDSYRSAIFYNNEDQKNAALASKKDIEQELNAKAFTEILQFTTFYPAEEYHQNYHKKNPVRYKLYRYGCSRDKRLKALWGE